MTEDSIKGETQKRDTKSIAIRGWRMLNTSILLIAFFAPWLRKCEGFWMDASVGSQVYTGYELSLEGGVFAIMGVSFIVYAVLNFVRALTGTQPYNGWLIVPLGGSILFLLNSYLVAGDLRWGYFLAWSGVLSSVLLDWFDRPILNKNFSRQLRRFAIAIVMTIILMAFTLGYYFT